MKYFLLLIVISLHVICFAQQMDSVRTDTQITFADDTIPVQQRHFSVKSLDLLKSDPNMNYTQPPMIAENLWFRILNWIAEMLRSLFDGAFNTRIGNLVLILLGIAATILVIMQLLKVNALRVFIYGADKGNDNGIVLEENIHEMNFEKLIQEAIHQQNYRLGTRLVFLYTLKILSDQRLIDWRPGRTNQEYVRELTQSDIQAGLNELSYYFDYAWYGHFLITADTFTRIQETFIQLRKKITK